ncbi:unnamed protein product [Blepharisma stoltei]|uniref:Cation/H+ exchanger transmembrane domain-containing protein n=1 Tax=Blepharisma stoltei TaxID=1481888 RepID=A0AAU9KBE2_9CILI|nr:unnamed protein product [Blepharisma stoltei]
MSLDVGIESIFCLILITLSMILSVYLPKYKIHYFHESGVIILIGIGLGAFMDGIRHPLSRFSSDIFFDFMLPFLILAAGFNMKRRRFFRNIGPIFLLGIIGTLICFVLIAAMAYAFSEWGFINHDGTKYLSPSEVMALGAVLSSSDVVCALALVEESKTPKLHSILFGESVINDAVGILLVNVVKTVSISNINATEVFTFIGTFLYVSITSILMGAVFGLIASFMTKVLYDLRDEPSKSIALQFYISILGYMIAKAIDLSAVIVLLVCGIISGHYAWYNLSRTSRTAVTNSFQFIGDASEALVFAYLGISAFTYKEEGIEWNYIIAVSGATIVSRLIAVFGLIWIVQLLSGGKFKMSVGAISVIWMGGIIRGAVSFALSLDLDFSHKDVLRITVLGVVIGTTLVFGTVLPLWVRWIKPDEGNDDRGMEIKDDDLSRSITGRKSVFLAQDETKTYKNWVHKMWRTIDDKYIKPWLIHKDALEEVKKAKANLAAKNLVLKDDNDTIPEVSEYSLHSNGSYREMQ